MTTMTSKRKERKKEWEKNQVNTMPAKERTEEKKRNETYLRHSKMLPKEKKNFFKKKKQQHVRQLSCQVYTHCTHRMASLNIIESVC